MICPAVHTHIRKNGKRLGTKTFTAIEIQLQVNNKWYLRTGRDALIRCCFGELEVVSAAPRQNDDTGMFCSVRKTEVVLCRNTGNYCPLVESKITAQKMSSPLKLYIAYTFMEWTRGIMRGCCTLLNENDALWCIGSFCVMLIYVDTIKAIYLWGLSCSLCIT